MTFYFIQKVLLWFVCFFLVFFFVSADGAHVVGAKGD